MNLKKYSVYLGRFSPFHRGHSELVRRMISKYGVENSILMIGSSSSYNERTPYTFKEREKIIKTIFPEIKVLPLPDVQPDLMIFNGNTNDAWLKSILEIEKNMSAKFKFVGGSKSDLEILSQKFETEVLFDRDTGARISATKVREALAKNDLKSLRQMVDDKVLDMVIKGYKNYLEKSGSGPGSS